MMTTKDHPRIVTAAAEYQVDPGLLAQAVIIYDQTLMGDSLAVERGIAAVLSEVLR